MWFSALQRRHTVKPGVVQKQDSHHLPKSYPVVTATHVFRHLPLPDETGGGQ
jgi:hypothetical protein